MRKSTLNFAAFLFKFLCLSCSESFALQGIFRKTVSNKSQKLVLFQSSSYADSLSKTDIANEVSCDALGGTIKRIKLENEEESFLTKVSVPTFAAFKTDDVESNLGTRKSTSTALKRKRMGLEGLVPGAFLVENAISTQSCEEIINACEKLGFGKFDAGRNQHGAIQLLVTPDAAESVGASIFPFIDMDVINTMARCQTEGMEDVEHEVVGLNRRWRIYRYETGGIDNFAPHIDAGFPPSSLSHDGSTLVWDATSNEVGDEKLGPYASGTVSRLTVLIYLNDDFQGGHTKFYAPEIQGGSFEVIAAVKPKAGSILMFPQAVGEEAVEYARKHWPLHEGSPVTEGSRPKYVIRSDVLFTKARIGLTEEEKVDPLWKNDELVRNAFLPKSPAISPTFLNHIRSLYNPHMGVENAGPLLYALIRFTKIQNAVEIGAGFTTPWILQALRDNDAEMADIKELEDSGNCKLLNYPFTPKGIVENLFAKRSSLLCIDNCLHQRETATGAAVVARTLGLSEYLEFVMGDAYDMQFEAESIDLLWCDFGVGSRMKDFAKGAWKSIRPGGFLCCHSTLTNLGTRTWLEAVRQQAEEAETGIPQGEFVEISFLEPHKVYQNSITILQRRKSPNSEFIEPIYSEYA